MNPTLRIISLAPGQTEVLGALGLNTETVGVTEHCDFPPELVGRRTYGTWFAPDLNAVLAERPDLVCTFGKHQEEAQTVLREAGLTVFHSDPETVDTSLEEMARLARITGREERGRDLIGHLKARLTRLDERLQRDLCRRRLSVFRIMHWDPLITVGPGAFQHDVILRAGGRNALEDESAPYVVCPPERLRTVDPDAIYFCEPFIETILASDPAWSSLSAVQTNRVYVFDCGLTCRSGPRIVDMVEALAKALYPECFPDQPGRP